MQRRLTFLLFLCLCAAPLLAEDAPSLWSFRYRLEARANYRDSRAEAFRLRFPFTPEELPPGQTSGFMRTPEPGHHVELSVAQLQLDLGYGKWISARAKIHAQDKYRRNPTSTDRKIDADELWIRLGEKPEFLDRPAGTSFFIQAGKAPKMERQPIRLLESYGLAATSFNRMEDTQVLVGGTIGRNLYWRLQAANGNTVFMRDPNALAGDNGTPALLGPERKSRDGSGFPILYNAEVESVFFDTKHVQYGEGAGYRWQRSDEKLGFDAIVFHYRRSLAGEDDLTGTFYGGDIDLLDGAKGISLPITSRVKKEYGGRVYAEWYGLTSILQFTKQNVAGLQRQGYEAEFGYEIKTPLGLLQSIQPAARISGLTNRFRGLRTFPAPSLWWPWTKIDYGVRVGFARNTDVTVEHSKHNIGAPVKLDISETLVTLRIRV